MGYTGVGTEGDVYTANSAGTFPNFQPVVSGNFSINEQVFTTNGTYTPTTNTVYVVAEVVGGGGGGGGTGSPSSAGIGGGGGGAGGYARGAYPVATLSGQTITIGTGGSGTSAGNGNGGTTSSIGSIISASGGGGRPVRAARCQSDHSPRACGQNRTHP